MTLQVTTKPSPRPDVVVFALSGTPAEDLLALFADGVAELTNARHTVVVDLDGLVMTKPSTMRSFLARLVAKSADDRVVLQCTRLTGRKVLRRWTNDDLSIITTLIDTARPAPATEVLSV